jgi:hypothetical protein
MAKSTRFKSRRSAAQLYALAGVERVIRSTDPNGKSKYLREFARSFRSYESALDRGQWNAMVGSADVVLVGDYHALPASQASAAELLLELARSGNRPVVLGLETIISRDQPIVEQWWERQIDEAELRRKIRFDTEWGYGWDPFYSLLSAAREHAKAVYGLDCLPRQDLRRIAVRDLHAARKIGDIRRLHPDAVILILIGESHLAPSHLPRLLNQELGGDRILTVLQNIDPLYWQAVAEAQPVERVKVSDEVVCVFNSTPLDKYENYRLCLQRWSQDRSEQVDFTATIHNLIRSLAQFLKIARGRSRNPAGLAEVFPEVHSVRSPVHLRRLLPRVGMTEESIQDLLFNLQLRGCAYVPEGNAFLVRDLRLEFAAEEAARYLYHAHERSRSPSKRRPKPADWMKSRVLEHALGYLGSRALCPARTARLELPGRDLPEAREAGEPQPQEEDQLLGYSLGGRLFDEYLSGALKESDLRRLFLDRKDQSGIAHRIYLEIASHQDGRSERSRAASAGQ